MKVFLIRHGQKLPEAGDPGLSETGLIQARETGEFLKTFSIQKIISSPFKRTVETAQQIAQVLNMNFSQDNRLEERMNWNKSIDIKDFLHEWNLSTHNRNYRPKYGRSSFSTGIRIAEVVKELDPQLEHVALITHGGSILDYLRNVFGDLPLEVLKGKYIQGEDYQMNNCAINILTLSNKPTLDLLNYVDHLSEISE